MQANSGDRDQTPLYGFVLFAYIPQKGLYTYIGLQTLLLVIISHQRVI